MRFMVIVRATKDSEAGVWPDNAPEMFAAMNDFNQGLARDGVLLAADGLQPSSKGARMKFGGPKPVVTDGPFAETKELIAGFWLVQGKSKDEIVERFRAVPFTNGEEIEIRQVFEVEDFGDLLPPQVREFETQRRG